MQDNSLSNLGKIILKILSLIVAIALWLFISYTLNPEMIREFSAVEIEYKMPNSHDMVILGDYTKSTNIRISGKRNDLIALSKDDVKANVDLKYANSKDEVFRVNVELPSKKKFNLVSIGQTSVKLNLDDLISKDFEVEIRLLEENNDKNRWLECKAVPPSIQIKGPRSEIDKIKGVYVEYNAHDVLNAEENSDKLVKNLEISTAPIVELKDVDGEALNEELIEYNHENATLLCDVMEKTTVKLVFNKVHLGSDHLKIASQKISTDTINILGFSKDLVNVDRIYCTPVIPSEIDKAGMYRLQVKFDLSESLRILNSKDVYLDVEVIDIEEKNEDDDEDE